MNWLNKSYQFSFWVQALLLSAACIKFQAVNSFLIPERLTSFGARAKCLAPTDTLLTVARDGAEKEKKRFKRKVGGAARKKAIAKRKKRSWDEPIPEPRIVLANYDRNMQGTTTLKRLSEDSINCEHFDSCPGCVTMNRIGEVETILSAKKYFSAPWIQQKLLGRRKNEQRDFFRLVVPSPIQGWRTQAKLVVASKSSSWARDGCILGLYQRRSHNVVGIPNCSVHHPAINAAVKAIERATKRVGTSAYQEASRDGLFRYAQLQVERTTGKICLTLVWNAEDIKQTQPALSQLTKELLRNDPNLWHSMWLHCNSGLGNNIFDRNPRRWHRLNGPEFLREPLPIGDKGWLYFSPLNFRQGNMDGFDIIANSVARIVPDGSRVCELYAGVGILGLSALVYHAQTGGEPLKWVRCSDENPSNTRCFKRTISSIPVDIVGREQSVSRTQDDKEITLAELVSRMQSGDDTFPGDKRARRKTSYMVASASQALRSGQALGANVLIVDPPRKGLEPDVLAELCKPFNPDQNYVEDASMLMMSDEKVNWTNDVLTLVYVSCGFDALARDAEMLLTSNAGWMLESATGYILFPGSDHVETLCVFQRNQPKEHSQMLI